MNDEAVCRTAPATPGLSKKLCHHSSITRSPGPVTCLALPTFYAMLVQTVFILMPLEARRNKTFSDEDVGGLMIDRKI